MGAFLHLKGTPLAPFSFLKIFLLRTGGGGRREEGGGGRGSWLVASQNLCIYLLQNEQRSKILLLRMYIHKSSPLHNNYLHWA